MSISAEEKVCYLREAAIVLAKEGFQLDEVHTDRLCILLDGSPLCEVTGSGGVAYRNEDIDEPERIAAKDKVYEIVSITAEYMRQMEMAPFLKADGLEDGTRCWRISIARCWQALLLRTRLLISRAISTLGVSRLILKYTMGIRAPMAVAPPVGWMVWGP